MKKIIAGKIYDTKTAELIARWDNGFYQNDFNFCEETLYRTKKGAWFLVGEGGANSGYASHQGNSFSGGEELTPLSEREALEWLESKGETEAIEVYFADKVEEA